MGIGEATNPLRDMVVAAMDELKVDNTVENPDADMGPVIDGVARDRLFARIEQTAAEGTAVVRDGRQGVQAEGFFVGPTLLDEVTPEHSTYNEELFGPVLSVMHPKSLEEAIDWVNRLPYGNAGTIFTTSGAAARQFSLEAECGMIGVNLGVPAPMALFSFSGWDQSFYGDLHVQGVEGVMFYTRQKTVLSRWDSDYRRVQGW